MYLRDPEFGCWLWQRSKSDGYGVIYLPGRREYAHRYFWKQEYGELPQKIQLDHMCRRRACCFPKHLFPVTNRENTKRIHEHYRKTLKWCPENHLLAETGLATPEGGVVCRICSGV